MTVSTTELASILGISRQRVNELGRLGKIDREADGRWDSDKAQAALRENLDHRRSTASRKGFSPPADPPEEKSAPDQPAKVDAEPRLPREGTVAYETHRLTKEKADRAALERAELEGSLVRADEVRQQWTEAGIAIRDAVMGLGSRVCHRLPEEWRREVTRVLEDEARQVLTALSDDIRNRQADR